MRDKLEALEVEVAPSCSKALNYIGTISQLIKFDYYCKIYILQNLI